MHEQVSAVGTWGGSHRGPPRAWRTHPRTVLAGARSWGFYLPTLLGVNTLALGACPAHQQSTLLQPENLLQREAEGALNGGTPSGLRGCGLAFSIRCRGVWMAVGAAVSASPFA